jgi:hypothetical protein
MVLIMRDKYTFKKIYIKNGIINDVGMKAWIHRIPEVKVRDRRLR